ncbi:uncharacterized protein LOC141899996 isoform X2 [Tubulanus polymorphus]|uniref:uncharacterized protein LOC141899996 isoform X2 n=1 Tax=Tubulanus polymorphus TaxID=672921 RepID=UPI003DA666E2
MIGDHETRSFGGRSFKNKSQRSDDDLLASPPARHSEKYNCNDEVGPFRSPLREENMNPSQEERRVRREQQCRRRNPNRRFSAKRNNNQTSQKNKEEDIQFTEKEFPPLNVKSDDTKSVEMSDSTTVEEENVKSPNWAEQVEECERKLKETVSRRRLRLSESSACSGQSEVSTSMNTDCTEIEGDEAVLARRQKQIDYGKNTEDYHRYVEVVKKDERKKCMPKTPCKYQKYSRRGWDGLVRSWKKKIHMWESVAEKKEPKLRTEDLFGENGASSKRDCPSSGDCSAGDTQSQDSGCMVNDICSPDVEQSKKFFDDSLDLGNESP